MGKATPPLFWRTLLRWVLRGPEGEFVLGDIEEDYRAMLERHGPRAAGRWYRRQALGSAWAWITRKTASRVAASSQANKGGVGMETTLRDVRYAMRSLVKRPGFTALVVVTLALGVGANTAIFSVVEAVMLRALPFPESDRLVDIAESVGADQASRIPTSALNYRDWKEGTTAFDRMALSSPYQSLTYTDGDEAQRLRANFSSSEYLEMLGAKVQLGRLLLADEDGDPGDHPVVVLSDGTWQRLFGGDPGVIGRSVTLSGVLYTVVGVLDPTFEDVNAGAVPTDIFVPASMIGQVTSAEAWNHRAARNFRVIGRLAPGRTLEQARPEIEAVMKGMQEQDPQTLGDSGVLLTPLRDQVLGRLDAPLLALLTGAVFLLLVGCINVASLMLVRGAARAREVAVRLALGAGRGRLIRQLTTEALLLALAGGAAGVVLAYATLGFLLDLSGNNLPAWVTVSIDPTVLAASILLSLVTGLAFGLVPAVRNTRSDLRGALTRGDARSGGGRTERGRNALVVVEVASAMILMVGSGLMIRSFDELSGTPMGFRTDHVLTAYYQLPTSAYGDPEQVRTFDQGLLERVRALPGVEFAHLWGPGAPGEAGSYTTILPVGKVVRSQLEADLTRIHNVSPGAMQAMGLQLLRGRFIDADDRMGSTQAVVISEGLAETLFPGEDAVGKQVNSFIPPGYDPTVFPPWEVVGVVANANMGGRQTRGAFAVDHDAYYNVDQKGTRGTLFSSILIGTVGDPVDLTPALRQALHESDPDVPLLNPRAMDVVVGEELVVSRFVAVLLGIFGTLSLFLAALGIYGVLSQTVSARSREIGLRVALGAQDGNTIRLFVGQGLRLTLLGVVLGLTASLGLTRFVSSLLYGVAPNDPLTMAGTSGILLGVALLAAWLPTRRALRVDPAVALRAD